MLANMPGDVHAALRRALQRCADGDEDEDQRLGLRATTTFIKKRRAATTPAHARPITTMNNLKQVWELVLMDVVQPVSEQLRDDAVFGFLPGRQTGEINCIISQLVAQSKATGSPLLVET